MWKKASPGLCALSLALSIALVSCSPYDPFSGDDPYLDEDAGPRRISGSFVQPWFVTGWTAGDWASEMADLKAAGVDDHLIWQWTVNSDGGTAYYPTRLEGYSMLSGMALPDPIATCLAEAQKAGLKVWLGLNSNGEWWSKYANDEAWLEKEFAISRAVAKELWDLYGGDYADTIAGFYLTMEVDNNNFCSNDRLQDRMKAVYGETCDYIHDYSDRAVMVAPYCSDLSWPWAKQEAWQAMWENILAGAAIDVINLQDGCGAGDGGSTHTSVDTVRSWFAATRKAIDDSRPETELWSDLETFDMDSASNCFCVKDFDRIRRQIEAVSPYVSRISSFAVMHYQTRVGVAADSTAAAQYYQLVELQARGEAGAPPLPAI